MPPGLQPFKPGPDPRRGKGPAKGAPNAGRPPDKFRAAMAEIAEDKDVLALVKAIARGESDYAVIRDKTGLPIAIDGNMVLKAHDHAAKYSKGPADQTVNVKGAGVVIVRVGGQEDG